MSLRCEWQASVFIWTTLGIWKMWELDSFGNATSSITFLSMVNNFPGLFLNTYPRRELLINQTFTVTSISYYQYFIQYTFKGTIWKLLPWQTSSLAFQVHSHFYLGTFITRNIFLDSNFLERIIWLIFWVYVYWKSQNVSWNRWLHFLKSYWYLDPKRVLHHFCNLSTQSALISR